MTGKSFMALVAVSVAVSIAFGCHPTPEEIWIPGDDYTESLVIELSASTVRVGEWLELDAERRTGPWILVPRPDEMPAGNCWWRRPPPAVEPDVAANVRWFVEPEGEFNLPSAGEGFARRVRFDRPGTYTIHAQSAGCPGPFESATHEIHVVP